jgi:hypothetical protein
MEIHKKKFRSLDSYIARATYLRLHFNTTQLALPVLLMQVKFNLIIYLNWFQVNLYLFLFKAKGHFNLYYRNRGEMLTLENDLLL